MRIATCRARLKRWPKYDWVAKALRSLGHEVVVVEGLYALRDADASCEVVLFAQNGAGLPIPDVIKLAQAKYAFWAQWNFDLYQFDASKPMSEQRTLRMWDECTGSWNENPQLRVMQAMDLVFVKERAQIEGYAELGVTANWMPQGCPSDMPEVTSARRDFDVLVFGSKGAHQSQRKADASALVKAGFSVAWAGDGGSVPPGVVSLPWTSPYELPTLASRAGLVLCVDITHDVDGYWSDRLDLSGGMGACVLRRWSPGLPDWVRPNVYRTHGEMVEKAKRFLGDESLRYGSGASARRAVMAHYTYERSCQEVLGAIEACRQTAAA